MSPDHHRVLDENSKTVMASHADEVIHNYQKNSKQVTNWGGRNRRPQTCYAVVADQKCLSKVHKYNDLEPCNPLPATAAVPSHQEFVPSHVPTIDIQSVCVGQKPPYFSPNAENTGQPYADRPLINYLGAKDQLTILEMRGMS